MKRIILLIILIFYPWKMLTQTITDYDGNVYNTLTIGTQVWMKENLKVKHYRNSDSIAEIRDSLSWVNQSTGAWCNYNNNSANGSDYGNLYNWYAGTDPRGLAPTGWHIPSDEEWKTLEIYLGMSRTEADKIDWRGTDQGAKLKETDTIHWKWPTGNIATNSSNFTALGGGWRIYFLHTGSFYNLTNTGQWWTSTENNASNAWLRNLCAYHPEIYRTNFGKTQGCSIRCVRDLPAGGSSFNQNLSNMLQDTLNYYVAALSNIKGMSASVYYPGQGIWKGTSGVSYTGKPITSDMEFGIASNSKLFVAAAILKLTENNILHLNDSLHRWLSKYNNVDSNITIKQLLNHTSGVSDPIFIAPYMDTIKNNPTRVFTPEEVLSWLGAPQFSPGASFYYSNVNYILAGMIVESATGYHISKIIRDSILTPLNLDSTFYDVEEQVLGTIAHRWYNSVDFHDTSRVGLNSAGGAAGSIFSTSSEMVQWYHALLGGQILDTNSFRELTTFIDIQSAYKYSLGLTEQAFFGHNTWGHGGRTWGYKSRMVYDPATGAAVCGLTNSDPSGVDGVTLLLYKILVDQLPAVAGEITGTKTICQGQDLVTYTVPPITNANSYFWTLPDGATGTSATNSITVSYSKSAVSGFVTVKGSNSFGDGASSSLMITVNPVYNFVEEHSICEGDSYNWHGNEYSNSNTYSENYTSVSGCDSTHTLYLKVNPFYHIFEENSICEGEIYHWHGNDYSSSNTYTVNYNSIYGCDSTYTLYLKVNPSYHIFEESSICEGEIYRWHGNDYSSSNTYTVNYNSINGCDSTYTLYLNVNPSYNIFEEKSICEGEIYRWHGNDYSSSNTFTDNYTSVTGCDSIYTLILNVNPVYQFTENHRICKGDTYNWHGNNYSTPDIYKANYSTVNGCDSIYTLNLSVDTIPVGITLNDITATADFDADSYQWLDCDNNYSPVSGATEQSFSPKSSGNYAVLLTRDQCSDTSECVQIIISDVDIYSIHEKGISIFPNPANEYIEIKLSESFELSESYQIRIYNVYGECVVLQEVGQTSPSVNRIDVSGLAVGLYFVRIGQKNNKFMKM